jgi:uncharacterized membrane protein YhaH (DUF805 family)
MGFINAIKSGIHNRINFSGRSTRSEFWYWNSFVFLFCLFLLFVWGNLSRIVGLEVENMTFIAVLIIVLGVILPGFAMMSRRLHDLGRRGWWWILFIVPIIGQIMFLIWMCMRGTRGPNRFGADPLESRPVSS